MRNMNCGGCGKNTSYLSAYYCPKCGATMCPECAKKENNLCRRCLTPLERLC